MTKQRMVLVVAVVAALIAVSLIANRSIIRPNIAETGELKFVGEVAAEETVRLLSGKGQIAVIVVESGWGKPSWIQHVARGFAAKIRGHEGVRLKAQEVLSWADAEIGLRVRELILKHDTLDAIVLMGAGDSIQIKDIQSLPPLRSRLISVLTFEAIQAMHLMGEGKLALAVESRPELTSDNLPVLQSIQEIFNSQYVVISSKSIGRLQEELKAIPTTDFVP